ncbi:MAG: DUF342 domain-containing protein [bacterium]|nr:DUF342 domain-containing protein [bacterium]
MVNRESQHNAFKSRAEAIQSGLNRLSEGLSELNDKLRRDPSVKLTAAFVELEDINGFLNTLNLISETMPEDRVREAGVNAANSIVKCVRKLPTHLNVKISGMEVDPKLNFPLFLVDAIRLFGPAVRVSNDEMRAWVMIRSEELDFFRIEDVKTELARNGVIQGVEPSSIEKIFTTPCCDREICVANGKEPVPGVNGRLKYEISIEDISHAPKLLENGNVSFKDIRLFEYLTENAVLMRLIPPTPGQLGYTVTGKTLNPPKPLEAQLPDIAFTKTSADGTCLQVVQDCCVTIKNGKFNVQPMLHITSNISYTTGNIDSDVAVVIDGDVLTDFSVKSNMDIHVKGVVEGARLETKGGISIGSGVQGKDKARLEANGDVAAKFFSQAVIDTLGKVMAESEIIHCKIWAGGGVEASGKPGCIIGGVLEADGEVKANVIGSEIGEPTIVRLGGRIAQIAEAIEQTRKKVAEQEAVADQCENMIESLTAQKSNFREPSKEIEEAIQKASSLLENARHNAIEMQSEYDDLQIQYDEALKQTRVVKAKKNIWPGVEIEIQGVVLKILKPTGPAMLLKQGDRIQIYPWRDEE